MRRRAPSDSASQYRANTGPTSRSPGWRSVPRTSVPAGGGPRVRWMDRAGAEASEPGASRDPGAAAGGTSGDGGSGRILGPPGRSAAWGARRRARRTAAGGALTRPRDPAGRRASATSRSWAIRTSRLVGWTLTSTRAGSRERATTPTGYLVLGRYSENARRTAWARLREAMDRPLTER